MPDRKPRPSIAELEAILDDDSLPDIEIRPDGEVVERPREAASKPLPLTKGLTLGSHY